MKRLKPESDQEGKEKKLRDEVEKLKEKKKNIKFGKVGFAGIPSGEKKYLLEECEADIAKENERLDVLYRRSSTPTNDKGSVNDCDNMKKLLEAMKKAKMKKGVIDLSERAIDEKGLRRVCSILNEAWITKFEVF